MAILYKYIGLKDGAVRTDFLNGLFRFTQPNQLNDPHEVYPEISVNKYSPEDIEQGRAEGRKIGIPEDEIDSKWPMFLAVAPRGRMTLRNIQVWCTHRAFARCLS
jgi:hypothetical protein